MPRCKNCKTKFEPAVFNQKYCFKDDCVKAFNKETWKKVRKPKLKKELETVQDLIKKAERYFNAYIRERDKGKQCISCDKELTGKYDAGHFYSAGGHFAVRFDETNVHGQCVTCNQHKHGNLLEYRERLIERIGQTKHKRLEKLSKETRKFTRDDLNDIISEYKRKIKEL